MDREDNTELNETIRKLNDFFKEPTPWHVRLRCDINFWLYKHLPIHEITRYWYMFLIWLYGYRLIKCVDYMFEYTFIFKTQEEADAAFYMLENRGHDKRILVTGWWYGEKEFEKALEDAKKITFK